MSDRLHIRLLVVVAALSVAAAVGVVLLWPGAPPSPAGGAPLLDAIVRSATDVDCPVEDLVPVRPPCRLVEVELREGPERGTTFSIDTGEQGLPPLAAGDRVKAYASEGPDGTFYAVADYDRLPSLVWLVGLFAVAVIAAGRWQGLRSLLGLALSLLVIVRFVVPAIIGGANPLAVAVVGAFAVLVVTLYLAHGVNVKTTTALLATAAALCLTVALGAFFAGTTRLTGLSSEDAQLIAGSVQGVSLSGLVLAGLVIGALGALDDVTVSQASTVFALRDADPTQGVTTLFRRGMTVGRDHIASAINTLVLVYAGASIPLLLLFSLGGAPFGDILNSELVAQDIVKSLVGSIGLTAAVPLTTLLAAVLAVHAVPAAPRERRTGRDEPVVLDADYEDWVQSLGTGLPRRSPPSD